MNRDRILVDTGPIVAILAENDAAHDRCVEASQQLTTPFITSWPVLTEAAWLLRHQKESIPKLMGLLEQGLIECVELDRAAWPEIGSLVLKYADIQPQLADLSLVYIALQENIRTVFTLDHRDFSIYRADQKQPFHLIP